MFILFSAAFIFLSCKNKTKQFLYPTKTVSAAVNCSHCGSSPPLQAVQSITITSKSTSPPEDILQFTNIFPKVLSYYLAIRDFFGFFLACSLSVSILLKTCTWVPGPSWHLIVYLPAFRTVRNKCLLFSFPHPRRTQVKQTTAKTFWAATTVMRLPT